MTPTANPPPHVLVMNDEQAVLDVLADLLEEEGYRVTAKIFLLDLDAIKELQPDVMVLDIMFAGESKGWGFLTMARLDREVSRIPIVLCTAAVTTVDPMRDHLAEQRVRVIYKPFDIDELLGVLADVRRGAPADD